MYIFIITKKTIYVYFYYYIYLCIYFIPLNITINIIKIKIQSNILYIADIEYILAATILNEFLYTYIIKNMECLINYLYIIYICRLLYKPDDD